jgi:hypothetical protein
MWVSAQVLIARWTGRRVSPSGCELVVDADRYGGRDATRDEPVPLQRAKRLGEHLLAGAGDDPGQLVVAQRPLGERI